MPQVQITVTEDENELFGHALISFPCRVGATSTLSLSITRKSLDTPYLGDDGWQAPPATVNAKVVGRSDTETTVVVGPAICRRIPVDLQVGIAANGLDIWGAAFWPAVTTELPEWIGEIATPAQPASPLQQMEKAVDVPLPPPLPPPPKPAPSPQPTSTIVARKPRKWPYYMLAVFLLLAGAAWLALPNVATESLEARFERLKLADNNGAELSTLSLDAFTQGNNDIGLKALVLAVDRGDVPAKLNLARLNDPRFADPGKMTGPDANKAARYYFELSVEENAEAADLLASLCSESTNQNSPYADQFDGLIRNMYCEGDVSP